MLLVRLAQDLGQMLFEVHRAAFMCSVKERVSRVVLICAFKEKEKKKRRKHVLGLVLLWFPGEAFTVGFKRHVNEEHVL